MKNLFWNVVNGCLALAFFFCLVSIVGWIFLPAILRLHYKVDNKLMSEERRLMLQNLYDTGEAW